MFLKILTDGKIVVGKNKAWFGSNKVELTKESSYTHPTYKVCNYAPDLTGYATIGYVDKQIASNQPKTHPNGFTYYHVETKSLQWYECFDRERESNISNDTLIYQFTAPSNIAAVYLYTNLYAELYNVRNRNMVLYFNENGVTTKMLTSSFSRTSITDWYYFGESQYGDAMYAQLTSNTFSLWGDSVTSEDDSQCGGTFNIEVYY